MPAKPQAQAVLGLVHNDAFNRVLITEVKRATLPHLAAFFAGDMGLLYGAQNR